MELRDLSVQELEIRLNQLMGEIRQAQKEFQQTTAQMSLAYKRIQPKGLSTSFTNIKFDSDTTIKEQLISKIQTAQARLAKIKSLTAKVSKMSPEQFKEANKADLSDSTAIKILRNLGATEEEINLLLSKYLAGDEDYDEIKDVYDTYKANEMLENEGAEEIKPMSNEEMVDFFRNGHQ